MSLLEQTKTLVESALQLIYAAKECGGNPAATEAFAEINDAAGNMTEAVKDLRVRWKWQRAKRDSRREW